MFDIACNWKIATENFLEAYHIRMVHPAMYEAFDMSKYYWEMQEFYTNLTTFARVEEGVEIYDWNEIDIDEDAVRRFAVDVTSAST